MPDGLLSISNKTAKRHLRKHPRHLGHLEGRADPEWIEFL